MSYSKLFSSLVHSSLWTEQDHVRILFITLLAIADREGYCYGSRRGLERLAMIDPDHIDDRDPWSALMSPDPDSSDLLRNPENEGRRIEEVPGGFRIINFVYYRSLRNEDDRREQNREAQRRHRAKVNQPPSAKVSPDQPWSAEVSQHKPISEAEAEKKKTAPARAREGTAGRNGYLDWKSKIRNKSAYINALNRKKAGLMRQLDKFETESDPKSKPLRIEIARINDTLKQL